MGGDWTTVDRVVICLGAALVVFFAGVTAAVAAGQTPPTELWAAGSAVSGGLLGLLVPAPGSAQRHIQAAGEAERAAAAASQEAQTHLRAAAAAGAEDRAGLGARATAAEDAAQKASKEAAEHRTAAANSADTTWAVVALFAVFVLTLVLSVALAGGWIAPAKPFVDSVKEITKAVIAIASASGTALIGMLAPPPSKS